MRSNRFFKLVSLAVALAFVFMFALLAAGCTTFQKGDLKYSNFVFDKKVGELTVETSPDGTTKATLKNAQSGLNADALKAVAEGAATGAVIAVKP